MDSMEKRLYKLEQRVDTIEKKDKQAIDSLMQVVSELYREIVE